MFQEVFKSWAHSIEQSNQDFLRWYKNNSKRRGKIQCKCTIHSILRAPFLLFPLFSSFNLPISRSRDIVHYTGSPTEFRTPFHHPRPREEKGHSTLSSLLHLIRLIFLLLPSPLSSELLLRQRRHSTSDLMRIFAQWKMSRGINYDHNGDIATKWAEETRKDDEFLLRSREHNSPGKNHELTRKWMEEIRGIMIV